jgi:hypothetical protein
MFLPLCVTNVRVFLVPGKYGRQHDTYDLVLVHSVGFLLTENFEPSLRATPYLNIVAYRDCITSSQCSNLIYTELITLQHFSTT